MKKPDISGLTEEQVKYIEYLESLIEGSVSLVDELNITSGVIASEIKDIRLNGSILSNDKNFDKILQLIEKASKIRALSDKKKEEPTNETVEEKTVTTTFKKKTNIQDFIVKP